MIDLSEPPALEPLYPEPSIKTDRKQALFGRNRDVKQRKATQMCRLCSNHAIQRPFKGHKNYCPFVKKNVTPLRGPKQRGLILFSSFQIQNLSMRSLYSYKRKAVSHEKTTKISSSKDTDECY